MRKLMLATASAVVLAMAGAGIGHAAEPYSSPTNPPGSATHTPRAMTAPEILLTAAQLQLKSSGLYTDRSMAKWAGKPNGASAVSAAAWLRQSGALDGRTMTVLQGDIDKSVRPGTRGQAFRRAGSDYSPNPLDRVRATPADDRVLVRLRPRARDLLRYGGSVAVTRPGSAAELRTTGATS